MHSTLIKEIFLNKCYLQNLCLYVVPSLCRLDRKSFEIVSIVWPSFGY